MSEGEDKPSLMLEAEGPNIADYAGPAALALGGAGLLFFAWRGSKKKKDKETKKPKAEANEVIFTDDYKSFSVGKDWVELTLEPFLAEQAEEYELITADYEGTMEGLTVEQLRPMMKESRKKNLDIFFSTYKAKTVKGEEIIFSKLPDNKATKEFKSMVDSETEAFQEQY